VGVERQEFYRSEYRRRKPEWRDSVTLYREKVDAVTRPGSRILDLGCGHADVLRTIFAKSAHCFGIDPDVCALEKNQSVPQRVAGVGEYLPFPDGQFDVVVAAWVIEHLDDPLGVAREVHRVLRPGGRFIFLTPNAVNPNTWLIRAVPNRLHDPLARQLYGRQEHDTYRVRYRMNTPRTIERILGSIGFDRECLILNGDPSYLSFDPVTFRLACWLEHLIERLWGGTKVHMIGVYTKDLGSLGNLPNEAP
jgi:SAM-dependent methyltransferase